MVFVNNYLCFQRKKKKQEPQTTLWKAMCMSHNITRIINYRGQKCFFVRLLHDLLETGIVEHINVRTDKKTYIEK